MEAPSKVIVSVVVIGILLIIGIFIYGSMQEELFYEEETVSSNFIPSSSYIFTTDVSGFSGNVYNKTWIDCDGVNDYFYVLITESKSTVSLWFKNETTNWTSYIKSYDDVYINGVLESSWDFSPFFYVEAPSELIIFCASSAGQYLNISIDAVRVYEQKLNSTEVLEVYNYGR